MDELQRAAEDIAASPKTIDDNATKFIVQALKQGKQPELVVEKLVAAGYPYQASYDATHQFYSTVAAASLQKEKGNASTDILIGLVILVIGIGVTVASQHVIAYGAIGVGLIKLIRGISNA